MGIGSEETSRPHERGGGQWDVIPGPGSIKGPGRM